MKIGKFAKKNNLTVDTIRYYVELGLLLPEKVNNQFSFDEKCQNDLEEIINLKNMRFSISQIQSIFSTRRFTKLINDEELNYYISFFENKKNELIKEKKEIDKSIDKIDKKIEDIKNSYEKRNVDLGIPVSFLSNLSCPKCNKSLNLVKGNIENNQIFNGELKCKCGYEAKIEDGILITENAETYMPENLEKDNPGNIFVKKTNMSFANLIYKGMSWIYKRLNQIDLKNINILEIGTGSGFFLKKLIESLDDTSVYIAVDNNLEFLKSAKKYLQAIGKEANIVFIACDFKEIPLQNDTCDILLDVYGTADDSLNKDFYPIRDTKHLLKNKGFWYGTYIHFNDNSKTLTTISREAREKYKSDFIRKSFASNGFEEIESSFLGKATKYGESEPFIVDGDIVNHWGFVCRKYI
ncbi:MAG: MerR family transcriptional regulator [Thermotogota bacterium]